MQKYIGNTSHTSNDVLSAQANCPTNLSLDEFAACGHLRSGGSLQWLNILRELRSRTLNLRRHEVHFLLSHTVFQVGPLDLNTGMWIWHQEIQDSPFCHVLLDELENSFKSAGCALIDGVLMNTISMLLTRILALSPSEDISERAIALLRRVRMKMFSWVRQLSYDLTMAPGPANEERRNLLLDMAATCRSTFDVGHVTLCKLFRSPEDVDALLSCTFFIRTLYPTGMFDSRIFTEHLHFNSPDLYKIRDQYLKLLLSRDCCLSPVLEEVLKDSIFTDPSDRGIDLAVANIFTGYRSGTYRWGQLQYPNDRWLTCETEVTLEQPKQMVHINLLDGQLRVAGQPLCGLPDEIRGSPVFRQVFQDVCICHTMIPDINKCS